MMDAVKFIPHEKPMVFVDHLIEVTDEKAIAELHITPDLMFCESEGSNNVDEHRNYGANS